MKRTDPAPGTSLRCRVDYGDMQMSDKTPEERIGINESDITTLKGSDRKQWEAINKLQNRLPNWAVFVIAGLSGALGWSLQYASTAVKLAGK